MSIRAAPNYGTELPSLHTLPDIYPFISFSKSTRLLQHQSFLQLVLLLVLLYPFKYHRFGLDNYPELTSTGSFPTASFSRNAYNTLFTTQSTVQRLSFHVIRTYRSKIRPVITPCPLIRHISVVCQQFILRHPTHRTGNAANTADSLVTIARVSGFS